MFKVSEMPINIKKISEIIPPQNIISDGIELEKRYCKPILSSATEPPLAAVFPINTGQISQLIAFLRTIENINVLIVSSSTSPKFLDDTVPSKNTIIMDLTKMTEIPFINRRNKVCVVEPGVTWADLLAPLMESGLRPRAPFLPRKGKSALASILDREPHLVPKAQFDISDPLLCMEVVFGNGEIFRTGEAAGPQSIKVNRQAGAALTNPIGPAQTDIFRLIQGSKGTYGCVSWVSLQCDFIPTIRSIKFLQDDSIQPLTEFIYSAVRRRLVDEIFIINDKLFKAIFPSKKGPTKKFILIYAINGYEWLPEEKLSYQTADCNEISINIGLVATDSIAGIEQKDMIPILDGQTVDPHPKYSDQTVATDIFYTTTLDRLPNHIAHVENFLEQHQFPLDRLNIYIQPVIQARATHLEFSLIADRPEMSNNISTSYKFVSKIGKDIAEYAVLNGGFFSRPYKLVKEFAFAGHEVYMDGLRRLKKIFDPNDILNKGELCF